MNLRRQMFISHIVFGYAGASLVAALTVAVLTLLPKAESLLAHSDQMAVNGVKATGVIANSSAQEATEISALTRDVRAQMWHADRTLTTADGTLKTAQGTIGTLNDQLAHVGPLLDSAKKATDAIPPVLNAATGTVAAAKPVLDHLDARITDEHVTKLMTHLEGMSASGDGILSDGREVSDKLTTDFLAPQPWYRKVWRFAGDTFDYGALVARHVP